MSWIDPVVELPAASRSAGTDRRRAFGFGATIAAVSGAAGLWRLHRGGSPALAHGLLAVAVVSLVYSLVHPAGALVVRSAWVRLGGFIGRVNSVILLSVAYVFVLTPLGFLMRTLGKRSHRHAPAQPYFTERTEPRDAKHFEHPY